MILDGGWWADDRLRVRLRLCVTAEGDAHEFVVARDSEELAAGYRYSRPGEIYRGAALDRALLAARRHDERWRRHGLVPVAAARVWSRREVVVLPRDVPNG